MTERLNGAWLMLNARAGPRGTSGLVDTRGNPGDPRHQLATEGSRWRQREEKCRSDAREAGPRAALRPGAPWLPRFPCNRRDV